MSAVRASWVRARGMTIFYVTWALACLLGFLTSVLLGFVALCMGVMVRLLEANLAAQREALAEQRALRRELLAHRARTPDERGPGGGG